MFPKATKARPAPARSSAATAIRRLRVVGFTSVSSLGQRTQRDSA